MKKFFKRVFYTVIIIIFVGLITAAGILGYLYDSTNKKNSDLKTEKNELSSKISALNDENDKLKSEIDKQTVIFEDDGMDVSVEYPASWKAVLTTELTEDFVTSETEGTIGPIAKKYALTLLKNSSVLTFEVFLGPTGFIPEGLDTNKFEYKILNDDVVRIAEKGTGNWKYVSISDCDDAMTTDSDNFEICYVSLFPGFSKEKAPNFVSLKTTDAEILEEADQIVLSSI